MIRLFFLATAGLFCSLAAAAQTVSSMQDATVPLTDQEYLFIVQNGQPRRAHPSAIGSTLPAAFVNPSAAALTSTSPQVEATVRVQQGPLSATQIYSQLKDLYIRDGLNSALTIPTGSTIAQANAIAGYVDNSAAHGTCTNGGGTCGVAGFFWGIGHAIGAKTWGINTLVWDNNTRSDTGLTGQTITNEFDFVTYNAGTSVLGLQVNGTFHAAPFSASAVIVNGDAAGSTQWSQSFVSQNGSSPIAFMAGLSTFSAAVNTSSQQIRLLWADSGATVRGARLTAVPRGTQGDIKFDNSAPGVIENIQLLNAATIYASNNAGSGWLGLVASDSGDEVSVGTGASALKLGSNGSGNTFLQVTPAGSSGTGTVALAPSSSSGGTGFTMSVSGQVFLDSTKSSNYTVTPADSGKHFNNSGSSGTVQFQLPVAAAGLNYCFLVRTAHSLQVLPQSGETISLNTSSLYTNNIASSTQYSSVCVEAMGATRWFTYATNDISQWTGS